MVKAKMFMKKIILLILILIAMVCYSCYLLYNDYRPSKETLEENKKIVQNDIKYHDESSKEFDEIIKKLEEKKKHPKQLEVEKQAQIAAEKEKTKQAQTAPVNQKPQKKEQKMTRYEDWIDEPMEVLPVENLELEKIQGPQQDER